jgi:hypothetical protein
MTSAWCRKAPLIADGDLRHYFDHVGIVVPRLPREHLKPVLETLLGSSPAMNVAFAKAVHLVICWTCTCQRLFARLASGESSISFSRPLLTRGSYCSDEKDRGGVPDGHHSPLGGTSLPPPRSLPH